MITLKVILEWAIILMTALFILTTIKQCLNWWKTRLQRKNYRVGMFSDNKINTTLRNVEEDSILNMILRYYVKPLYYIEITDRRKKNVEIIKQGEIEKSAYDTESYLRQQLRNGSKIKVLTTSDRSFHVTAFHEKKYYFN